MALYSTLLKQFSADGQIRTMDAVWRDEVLNDYLGAFCFNEYGLFNSHSSASRDCLGDTLRMSIAMIGLDKVDNAQMIQLERTFLAKLVPGFPESTDEPKKNGRKVQSIKVLEKLLKISGKRLMTGMKSYGQDTISMIKFWSVCAS